MHACKQTLYTHFKKGPTFHANEAATRMKCWAYYLNSGCRWVGSGTRVHSLPKHGKVFEAPKPVPGVGCNVLT